MNKELGCQLFVTPGGLVGPGNNYYEKQDRQIVYASS